ncbi:MAG: hypothetical protein HQ492_07285 [Woeseiaceae bacterium]|nr:hypothetical protein [Woeseiaceae bacterium]
MLQRLSNPLLILTLLTGALAIPGRAWADLDMERVIRVKAGALACELPAEWGPVDGPVTELRESARAQANEMAAYYESIAGAQTPNSGMVDIDMAQLRNGHAYLVAYSIRVPTQTAFYHSEIALAQNVFDAGIQQLGIASVNKNGTFNVGEKLMLIIDLSYTNKLHKIWMNYWQETSPDIVSRVEFILTPLATNEDQQAVAQIADALEVHWIAQTNEQVGSLALHKPVVWSELNRPRVEADIAASLEDFTFYGEPAPVPT